MPEIKLIVATCDEDGVQLECGGGYTNANNDSIIVWHCPECNSFYPAINGEFMGGKFRVLEPKEAEKCQFQTLQKLV